MQLARLAYRHRSNAIYWVSLLLAPIAAGGAAAFGLIVKGWRADIAATQGVVVWVMYISAGLIASMHIYNYRHETDIRTFATPPTPMGYEPVPQYAHDEAVDWQPDIILIPTAQGQGVTLHLMPAQLKELQRRIRDNKWGLPVNSMTTFTHTQVDVLRAEVLRHKLAEMRGREVHWTPDGALKILRASPTVVTGIQN